MRARLVSTIRRVVDVGTNGKEAAEARRIRTVNGTALFGVVVGAGFDAFYIATYFATGDSTLTLLILFVTGFIAFYGLIILLNRVLSTAWTAALIGAGACVNLMIAAAFLGPQAGFQLYMVPIAGLTALMTRRAHWPVPIGIAVLSVGLFTYKAYPSGSGRSRWLMLRAQRCDPARPRQSALCRTLMHEL